MKFTKSKEIRTAVILCGGKGTRLGNITKKIPKPLVEIRGKSIIWYILKMLKRNKFNHFILPIGYKGDQIKQYLKKKIFKNYNLEIVPTGINTPIAKRIFAIKKYIKSVKIKRENIFRVFQKHYSWKISKSIVNCCMDNRAIQIN